jgi:hypothetical protein
MVSDLCQTLERDGVFAADTDGKTMKIREPKSNEIVPTVFMENKPVTILDPIFFLVNVKKF